MARRHPRCCYACSICRASRGARLGLCTFLGAIVCALVIVVWWLLFSRAPWIERIGALVLMVSGWYLTSLSFDVSIRTAMMGNMLPVYTDFCASTGARPVGRCDARFPGRCQAGVTGGDDRPRMRRVHALRTDGVLGFGSQLTWRWSKTAEERLLAQTANEPLLFHRPRRG